MVFPYDIYLESQPTLVEWSLDLQQGSLVMTFTELDPNLDVKCSMIKVSAKKDVFGHALDDSDAIQDGNEIACLFGDNDKKAIQEDPDIDPTVGSAYVFINSGSGIVYQSKEFVSDVWVAVTRPSYQKLPLTKRFIEMHHKRTRRLAGSPLVERFPLFDLNTGRVQIDFDEAIDPMLSLIHI